MRGKLLIQRLKVLIILAFGIFFLCLCAYSLIKYIDFDPYKINFTTTSSKIYDSEGILLWEISDDNAVRHTPVKIENISKYCIDGIVAVEDKTFWINNGIDPNGLIRLGFSIFTKGDSGGGSTISQQVIKNSFQSIFNRDPLDKLQEIIFAIKMNSILSKEEILEMYLNNIYFGELNYGIETASHNYFGKSSNELNIAECAYLAGIPQWPGVYNPHGNIEKGKSRQIIVLQAMKTANFITEGEYLEALDYELDFKLNNPEVRAPHFVQFVKDNLYSEHGDEIYESHTVLTSYDYDLHKKTLSTLRQFVENNQDNKINNGAAVILDSKNNLLTMIGSIDFFNDEIDGKFNSSLGLRQPGSAYLPLLYSYTIDLGLDLKSRYSNSPFTVKVYDSENELRNIEIKNYGNFGDDLITLEEAFLNNQVVASTRLIQNLEVSSVEKYLNNFRVYNSNSVKCTEAMLVEGCEMSLVDLTLAYSNSFVNRNKINYIQSIDGELFKNAHMNNLLLGVSTQNLLSNKSTDGWVIQIGVVENNKDYFAIAFNQNYTVGVWIGNTKGDKLEIIEPEYLNSLITEITTLLK